MKILVTGGAGYIGSHVVLELCNSGYEVNVLDDLSNGNQESIDERAEFILGSTLVKKDIEKALNNVECVIHLAAFKAAGESMTNPIKYSQNNINGTITLLDSMIKKGIKYFVFSSTAAVYGNPKYLPLDEKHPLNPINFYGFTKLEIERILGWYGKLTELKFANLRYFNAAGHDPNNKIHHIEKEIKYFIFSSTAAVYGNPEYLPLDEKHPLNPINFYGFTKLEIERILKWYGKLTDLKFANLRYFNAAGHDPNNKIKHIEKDPQNLIPIVMEVASGKRKQVKIFGNDYNTKDGTGYRDYIHVTDLAIAHIRSFEYLKRHNNITLNLATGESHSVLDVINMTKEISNNHISYEFVDRRDGDIDELYAKSSRANDLLEWKPAYSTLKSILQTSWSVYSKNI